MINDKQTAIALVEEAVNVVPNRTGRLVVIDEETIEKDYGWIFFVNSTQYKETKSRRYLLATSRMLIEKESGRMYDLYPDFSLLDAIQNYEQFGPSSEPMPARVSRHPKSEFVNKMLDFVLRRESARAWFER